MKYLIIVLISFLFFSCEDPVPLDDYIPKKIVESYIFVGEPITGITVAKSQPLNIKFDKVKSFKEGASMVTEFYVEELDANKNTVLKLDLVVDSTHWSAKDLSYRVKAKTNYRITVKFSDGDNATGETQTPDLIAWNTKLPVKEFIQYPKDTINYPDRDTIGWSSVAGVSGFYMLSIRNLDTLEYGKYLNPPIPEEKNRRIEREFREDNNFKELGVVVLIANTQTTVVWNAFRFFGRHEITVHAPDFNMIRWYLANRASREYNPLLGSLKANSENTFGVFASTSFARDTTFLLKNQK